MFEFYTNRGEQKITTAADVTPVGSVILSPIMMTGAAGSVLESESAPDTFLFCNGAAVSRTTYAPLFSVIGVSYGAGNGSTTFNVPDFRNLFMSGTGGSLGGANNSSGGSATHTHTADTHTHSINSHRHSMPSGFVNHEHTYAHNHVANSHIHNNGTLSAGGISGTANTANAQADGSLSSSSSHGHGSADWTGYSGGSGALTTNGITYIGS